MTNCGDPNTDNEVPAQLNYAKFIIKFNVIWIYGFFLINHKRARMQIYINLLVFCQFTYLREHLPTTVADFPD